MNNYLRAATAAGLVALSCTVFGQSFRALGFSPEGTYSKGMGVSSDGRYVAGIAENKRGEERPVRWRNAVPKILPTLGGSYGEANDLSSNGAVVVGQAYNTSSRGRAFRWTALAGTQDLGTFGAGQLSYSGGVSADGEVVVGWAQNSSAQMRAFWWTSISGLIDIGDLGGGRAIALDVSADGAIVVGNSRNASNQTRAFRWASSGPLTDLGTLGGTYASAEGISPDGKVIIGESSDANGNRHAFKWVAGTMAALPPLATGMEARAVAASSDGKVIVGVGSTAKFQQRAVYWNQHRAFALQVVYREIVPAGWTLDDVEAVSPDGRFIVGTGTNPSGQRQGWILDRKVLPPPASNRTYVGTQSPGDVWRATLTSESFELVNETTAESFSGTVTALPSKYLKLSATSGAHFYAAEIPGSAVLIKHGGDVEELPIVAFAAGTAPANGLHDFNWVALLKPDFDPEVDPLYGTALLDVNGSTVQTTLDRYLGSHTNIGTNQFNLQVSNGRLVNGSMIGGTTPQGGLFLDYGPNLGALIGLRSSAITAADLESKAYRGVLMGLDEFGGYSNALWIRPSGARLSIGGYTGADLSEAEGIEQNLEDDPQDEPEFLNIGDAVRPGLMRGTFTSSGFDFPLRLVVGDLGGKKVIFGVGQTEFAILTFLMVEVTE